MTCPTCGQKCTTRLDPLGTWYDCPEHGLVDFRPHARQQATHASGPEIETHELYLDAMGRHEEAIG